MDFAFGTGPMIGHDILDIGSQRAMAKRQRGTFGPEGISAAPINFGMRGQIEEVISPAPLSLGKPGQFDLPAVDDPAKYCRQNFASVCGGGDEHQAVKFAKGTTTLAFKFNDGIIVSVDSRSTMGVSDQ